jgi:hypothetical protein
MDARRTPCKVQVQLSSSKSNYSKVVIRLDILMLRLLRPVQKVRPFGERRVETPPPHQRNQ